MTTSHIDVPTPLLWTEGRLKWQVAIPVVETASEWGPSEHRNEERAIDGNAQSSREIEPLDRHWSFDPNEPKRDQCDARVAQYPADRASCKANTCQNCREGQGIAIDRMLVRLPACTTFRRENVSALTPNRLTVRVATPTARGNKTGELCP